MFLVTTHITFWQKLYSAHVQWHNSHAYTQLCVCGHSFQLETWSVSSYGNDNHIPVIFS